MVSRKKARCRDPLRSEQSQHPAGLSLRQLKALQDHGWSFFSRYVPKHFNHRAENRIERDGRVRPRRASAAYGEHPCLRA